MGTLAERNLVTLMKKSATLPAGFSLEKLADALEEGHMSFARGDSYRKKTSFAPSGFGYGSSNCPRYWYIAFGGADFKETADSTGIAMMMTGSASHERIQKALDNAGVVAEEEKEMLWEDPPIRGFADLILEIDGERVVAEIKTAGPDVFLYRKSTGKPAVYHLYQILLYMMIEGTDKGVLLYEDRGNLNILPIMITMNKRNERILNDALDWMRSVRAHWEEGKEIPKRPWTKRNKACKSCPVFDTCWDFDAEIGTDEIGPLPEVKL